MASRGLVDPASLPAERRRQHLAGRVRDEVRAHAAIRTARGFRGRREAAPTPGQRPDRSDRDRDREQQVGEVRVAQDLEGLPEVDAPDDVRRASRRSRRALPPSLTALRFTSIEMVVGTMAVPPEATLPRTPSRVGRPTGRPRWSVTHRVSKPVGFPCSGPFAESSAPTGGEARGVDEYVDHATPHAPYRSHSPSSSRSRYDRRNHARRPDSSDEPSTKPTARQERAAQTRLRRCSRTEERFGLVAKRSKTPVYWAGPRLGADYKVTTTAVRVGSSSSISPRSSTLNPRSAYLSVGTYPFSNAYDATVKTGNEEGLRPRARR